MWIIISQYLKIRIKTKTKIKRWIGGKKSNLVEYLHSTGKIESLLPSIKPRYNKLQPNCRHSSCSKKKARYIITSAPKQLLKLFVIIPVGKSNSYK
jgi:hypothetical protein